MLRIVEGNIFNSGADVILHQVNCQGKMASGVAKQVRERYPAVYKAYIDLCSQDTPHNLLGIAQPVSADEHTIIVNIFAQENYGYDGRCYTDYDALKSGLEAVNRNNAGEKVAIPYLMGCHRGGGDWGIVYKMIEDTLTDCDVTLYRYDGS